MYRFADEIFTLGRDLQDTLQGRPSRRPSRLVVGIADVVPKLAAFQILEPVLRMPGEVRLVCLEGKPERLLDQLVAHELDLVLADAPIGPSHASSNAHARAYNHLLAESPVALFGAERLARAVRARGGFPASLAEMPMLLPAAGTALRRSLDGWLDEHGIVPKVVGEFQDSALALAFGELGAGLFAAPASLVGDALRARGLRKVGVIPALRERYYAISVERRLAHPAVVAIAAAAGKPRSGPPRRARGRLAAP